MTNKTTPSLSLKDALTQSTSSYSFPSTLKANQTSVINSPVNTSSLLNQQNRTTISSTTTPPRLISQNSGSVSTSTAKSQTTWVGNVEKYDTIVKQDQQARQQQSNQARSNTQVPQQKGSECVFCRDQGFFIYPLRYGVVGKQVSATALPASVGDQVKSHSLIHSKYTLKPINSGFIYVLVDGVKGLEWLGFRANETGQFAKFNVGQPLIDPPKFSCKNESHSGLSAMISISAALQPKKAYLLFSHCPLTTAKRQEIQKSPEQWVSKHVLQEVDIKAWQGGNTQQKHCMTESQLGNSVYEYPQKQAKRWEKITQNLKTWTKNAAAIALYDPLGMTIELNAERNNQFIDLLKFLEKKENGISNEHRLSTVNLIKSLEDGIKNKTIQKSQQKYNYLKNRDLSVAQSQADIAKQYNKNKITNQLYIEAYQQQQANNKTVPFFSQQNTQQRIIGSNSPIDSHKKADLMRQGEQQIEQIKNQKQASIHQKYDDIASDAAKDEWQKYSKLLDLEAIEAFKLKINADTEQGMAQADLRVDDHLKWLKSSQLIQYLNVFDNGSTKEATSNQAVFYEQVMEACKGMGVCKASAAVLNEWMLVKNISEQNIFMRAMLYNNKKAIDDYNSAIQHVKADLLAHNTSQSTIKTFVTTIAALDTAFQTWASDPANKSLIPNYDKDFIGRSSRWISEYTRSALNVMKATPVDRSLAAVLAFMLHSRTASLANTIPLHVFFGMRYRDVGGKLEAVETAEMKQARDAVKAATENRANLGGTRIAAAVMALEAINLWYQMNTPGTMQNIQLGIAATGLAAASLEVGGGIAGALSKQGAEVVLKFGAAAFASACAMLLAMLDFRNTVTQLKNGDGLLFVIYATRGVNYLFLSYYYSKVGLAFLSRAFSRSNNLLLKSAMKVGSEKFLKVILTIGRLNFFGLLLTVAEVTYIVFIKDNALEEWCKKSSFGQDHDYKDIAEEYQKFIDGFEEVIG